MVRNPILDEIYAARDKLLADFNGDVHAYIQDARERALASGRPIASLKQRTNRSVEATEWRGLPMENQPSPSGDRSR